MCYCARGRRVGVGAGDLVLNALIYTENTGSLGLSQVSSESYIIPQEPLTKMMFLTHFFDLGTQLPTCNCHLELTRRMT